MASKDAFAQHPVLNATLQDVLGRLNDTPVVRHRTEHWSGVLIFPPDTGGRVVALCTSFSDIQAEWSYALVNSRQLLWVARGMLARAARPYGSLIDNPAIATGRVTDVRYIPNTVGPQIVIDFGANGIQILSIKDVQFKEATRERYSDGWC